MKLTTAQIQAAILEIRDQAAEENHEGAHISEADLREVFIRHVAQSPNDPELAQKATLVLSTNTLEFNRWFA